MRLCLEWCERNEHPVELTRAQIQQYAAELIAAGKEASTVRLRLAALRQFARWLVSEGELPGRSAARNQTAQDSDQAG